MPRPTQKKPVILPTQKRSRMTFEILLEATTYLVEEIGIQEITTNKIADRAGVNINSLYQYFLDKHAVIRLITERFAEENRRAFFRSLEKSRGLKEKERALIIIGDVLDLITARPALHREILQHMPLIIGHREQDQFRNDLAAGLVDVIPEDMYPSERSRKIASQMLVHTFLNGALLILSPHLSRQDRKHMSDELRHMILRYVGINELSPRNYRDYFFYVPSTWKV